MQPRYERLDGREPRMIWHVHQIEAVAWEKQIVRPDELAALKLMAHHDIAADSDALASDDRVDRVQLLAKLRSQTFVTSGRSGSTERAVASHRRQVGALGSELNQSKWIKG